MSFPSVEGRAGSASPSERDGTARETFPREARLTRRSDFLKTYDVGVRSSGPSVVVFGRRNDEGRTRLGITVTRKSGPAAVRNLMKRRIREIFRRNRAAIPVEFDLVVNVRPGADAVPFERLREELLRQIRTVARKAAP